MIPPGCAVVDEDAWFDSAEAQHDILAGRDLRKLAATQRSDRSVEVDVVQELVARGVDERQLYVVAFVNHDHRSGYGAFKRHCPDEHSGFDFDLFFGDRHSDFHQSWLFRRDLVVFRD